MDFVPNSSPFRNLVSLRTLVSNIKLNGVTLTRATFIGLSKLRYLYITICTVATDTPFVSLSQLRYMHLNVRPSVRFNDNLFTGLNKIEYLNIGQSRLDDFFANFTFCSLVSLKSLQLATSKFNMSKCNQTVPLKSLNVQLPNTDFIFTSNAEPFKSCYIRYRIAMEPWQL